MDNNFQNQPGSGEPAKTQNIWQEIQNGMKNGKFRQKSPWFSRIFFGLLLVLFGAMLLAQTLGYVYVPDWTEFFGRIWPVFIIFAGLSIMSRGGLVAGIISSILMLLILAAMVIWFFGISFRFSIGSHPFAVDPCTSPGWASSRCR